MTGFHVSSDQIAQFQQDGYLLLPRLFDAEEIGLLHKIGKADQEKAAQTHDVVDAKAGKARMWLTSDTAREDIYNGFCHSRRMVETLDRLMGDEVYLYHYKMTIKEPKVGGAWEWHQDYGYWYNNGCLYPDMASCYIAVDPAHRENGCMQVIRSSHRLGRVEHGQFGGQAGADPARVELALQHLERVYCEMEAGDALFFHCNVLHHSDANRSDQPRWGLICCYNTRHNPCKDLSGHPSYTPLEKWDDSRIKEIGARQWAQLQK
jgi:ectoine hydroxylase-related dioxygenase (phytanoyl-CoA dioxygenase family)